MFQVRNTFFPVRIVHSCWSQRIGSLAARLLRSAQRSIPPTICIVTPGAQFFLFFFRLWNFVWVFNPSSYCKNVQPVSHYHEYQSIKVENGWSVSDSSRRLSRFHAEIVLFVYLVFVSRRSYRKKGFHVPHGCFYRYFPYLVVVLPSLYPTPFGWRRLIRCESLFVPFFYLGYWQVRRNI